MGEKVLVILIPALISGVLTILMWGMFVRLNTDYDSNLPIYQVVLESIQKTGVLPDHIPYAGVGGIPVLGDPLSSVLHPFIMGPLILLGLENGIRIILFLLPVVSTWSMWMLLKRWVGFSIVRLFGALTYGFSGALVARIAAGHIEKFSTYALLPLFFILSLPRVISVVNAMGLGFFFTLLLFGGDIYAIWLLFILFVTTRAFYVVRRESPARREVLTIVFIISVMLVFGSVRIVPFILDVLPRFSRYFSIDGVAGSLHLPVSLLGYIVPFRASFFDRPSVQALLGFGFNWYEYGAFISPFTALLLLCVRKIVRRPIVQLLLILWGVSVLYVAVAFPYSPFFWLSRLLPFTSIFRVPSRIIMISLPVVILLVSFGAAWFLKQKRKLALAICSIGLITTIGHYSNAFTESFETPRTSESHLVGLLAALDTPPRSAAVFACCYQLALIRAHIPITNYYYGWKTTQTPTFLSKDETWYDLGELTRVRPDVLILPRTLNPEQFDYTLILEDATVWVWKSRQLQ